MSWSLSLSGHTDDPAAQAAIADIIEKTVRKISRHSNATGTYGDMHGGSKSFSVNHDPDAKLDDEPETPEPAAEPGAVSDLNEQGAVVDDDRKGDGDAR